MDKKKTLRWLLIAAALLVVALVLRFAVRGSGILPYILVAAALVILIDLFHKNWAVLASSWQALWCCASQCGVTPGGATLPPLLRR